MKTITHKISDNIGIESFTCRLAGGSQLYPPDHSIQQLADSLSRPLTKSGVNHRFEKINKIADDYKSCWAWARQLFFYRLVECQLDGFGIDMVNGIVDSSSASPNPVAIKSIFPRSCSSHQLHRYLAMEVCLLLTKILWRLSSKPQSFEIADRGFKTVLTKRWSRGSWLSSPTLAGFPSGLSCRFRRPIDWVQWCSNLNTRSLEFFHTHALKPGSCPDDEPDWFPAIFQKLAPSQQPSRHRRTTTASVLADVWKSW